jgi:hypothetical protein
MALANHFEPTRPPTARANTADFTGSLALDSGSASVRRSAREGQLRVWPTAQSSAPRIRERGKIPSNLSSLSDDTGPPRLEVRAAEAAESNNSTQEPDCNKNRKSKKVNCGDRGDSQATLEAASNYGDQMNEGQPSCGMPPCGSTMKKCAFT